MISISFEEMVRGRARQLHGDGRAALRDASGAHVGDTRARQCERIDARVKPEALVLDRHQTALKLGVYFIETRLEAPRSLAGRERHQPFAMAIHHDR
jgi:hypothetical protein